MLGMVFLLIKCGNPRSAILRRASAGTDYNAAGTRCRRKLMDRRQLLRSGLRDS